MSHSLNGCWAKVERVIESIDNLNREINAYLAHDPRPYRIIGQHENNATEYVFRAESDPLPLRFPVLAGEIVHHLRSVLDHLRWALISGKTFMPSKHPFPICTNIKQFEAACRGGVIKEISHSAKKLIRSIQPYNASDPFDDPFFILHSYDIDDKHRMLLVVTSASYFDNTVTATYADGFTLEKAKSLGLGAFTNIIDAKSARQMGFPQPVREKRVEILTLRFANPAPHVKIEANFSIQIAFEKFGKRKLVPIIPGLVYLKDTIVKILNLFSPEFG